MGKKNTKTITEMMEKAAERPHKELSADELTKMKQTLSQSFVDLRCVYRAVDEGHITWDQFIDCGNHVSGLVEDMIATGNKELTSLACYLNDALHGLTYLHNASEVIMPVWVETMPKDMLVDLAGATIKTVKTI